MCANELQRGALGKAVSALKKGGRLVLKNAGLAVGTLVLPLAKLAVKIMAKVAGYLSKVTVAVLQKIFVFAFKKSEL